MAMMVMIPLSSPSRPRPCLARHYQKQQARTETSRWVGVCTVTGSFGSVARNSPPESESVTSPFANPNSPTVNQGLRARCRAGLEHQRGWRALTRRQCNSTTASDWAVGVIDLGPCSPSACLALAQEIFARALPGADKGNTELVLLSSSRQPSTIGPTGRLVCGHGKHRGWMTFCEQS